jgi:16S rRNA (guanine527-N7)-methyltransferase
VSARRDRLRRVLEQARDLGFLGPGPVDAHAEHALGFAAVVQARNGRAPRNAADLGSGGGVPGLVLALVWDQARITLIEATRRRSEHLRRACEALGVADRVEVLEARAEAVGRDPERRESFEVVTARAFAPAAVTAEVASGLVQVGGLVVVSEPPEPEPDRWPADELELLGFDRFAGRTRAHDANFVLLAKVRPAPADVPRDVGRPGKRPRW